MALEDLMKEVDWDHMTSGLQKEDEVYMICPVRKATADEREFLEAYKVEMEKRGFNAHYPATDTNQGADLGGYRICIDHCDEQKRAKQIHIFWNTGSTGSYVDLGTSLYLHRSEGKPIKLILRKPVQELVKANEAKGVMKSYEHVLLHVDDLAKKR
ncbi:Uncharacterised protein [uncultured archaeon]|nr:Uncharacterised protein [uncultured archaeon]